VGFTLGFPPIKSRALSSRVKTQPSRNRSSSSPTDKTLKKIACTHYNDREPKCRRQESEGKEGTNGLSHKRRSEQGTTYLCLDITPQVTGLRCAFARAFWDCLLRLLHRRYQKPVYHRAGYRIRRHKINFNQKSRGGTPITPTSTSRYRTHRISSSEGPRKLLLLSACRSCIQSPSQLKQPSRCLSFVFLQCPGRTNCNHCLIPGITAVLVEHWPLDDDASERHSFIIRNAVYST
jgi:hypothetical protein